MNGTLALILTTLVLATLLVSTWFLVGLAVLTALSIAAEVID